MLKQALPLLGRALAHQGWCSSANTTPAAAAAAVQRGSVHSCAATAAAAAEAAPALPTGQPDAQGAALSALRKRMELGVCDCHTPHVLLLCSCSMPLVASEPRKQRRCPPSLPLCL